MTDRIKGFTVTLDHDIRVDDVQRIIEAIQMIKGVADVVPSVSSPDDHINRMQVKNELRNKFVDFLKKEFA